MSQNTNVLHTHPHTHTHTQSFMVKDIESKYWVKWCITELFTVGFSRAFVLWCALWICKRGKKVSPILQAYLTMELFHQRRLHEISTLWNTLREMLISWDYLSELQEAVFSFSGQISMLIIFKHVKFSPLNINSIFFFPWRRNSLIALGIICTDTRLSNHEELAEYLLFGNQELSWILTL